MRVVVLLIFLVLVATLRFSPVGYRRRQYFKLLPQKATEKKIFDMAMLLTEVSTRLKSGATLEKAWQCSLARNFLDTPLYRRVLGFPDELETNKNSPFLVLNDEGVPVLLLHIWQLNFFWRWRLGIKKTMLASFPDTFAVCRMSYLTGAPAAQILDSCALGINTATEVESDRRVALAAPITSAKILAFLPIVGIGLGYVFGVNSLAFLIGTLFGHVVLLCAVFLESCGVYMVWKMVKRARVEAI